MQHDHPSADNLLSRLTSYAPSIGEAGQQRTALEDYCTEALAWCLRSPQFRRVFFELLIEHSAEAKKIPLCESHENGIKVHSQFGFSPADDNNGETNGEGGRRRFDLVIHSAADSNSSFVIVVEDKVQWSFTDNQIPAYQAALEKGKRFEHFHHKLLEPVMHFCRRGSGA